MLQRRVSGGPSLPAAPQGAGTGADAELVVDSAMAKRVSAGVAILVASMALWLLLVEGQASAVEETLMRRATVLAEVSGSATSCTERQGRLQQTEASLKASLKATRRKKNKDALQWKKKEQVCSNQLEHLTVETRPGLDYERQSLEARLGGDSELALRFWMAEALARLQGIEAPAIAAKGLSDEDLHNTLVVELAQFASVAVETLQGLLPIELVQMVEERTTGY